MEENNVPDLSDKAEFSRRDWLAVLLGLGLGALWLSVFSLDEILERLPALGAALFTAAIWAAVLIITGREARWSRLSAGLAVGVALLTLECYVFGSDYLRAICFLLIAAGSALCFFSITGRAFFPLDSVRAVGETVKLTFIALFSNVFRVFPALGRLFRSGNKRSVQILLGVLAALVLLAVVLPLLGAADAVFSSLFTELRKWLEKYELTDWLMNALKLLFWTLLFFSALYFLLHGGNKQKSAAEREPVPAATLITVLALLCAVYAVFAAIQFAFLFGVAETAAMEGGYAEYARSGFFQLVWVAAINLALTLFCAVRGGGRRIVNIMSTVLLALTAVILFSAFWRMRLYILAFGLSVLRALTLWAMVFIAACLILAALRIWRRGFLFWPWFAALGLYGWILFMAIGVDARVADYNVDAYLEGRLEQVDTRYLATLSADTIPALERLRDAVGGDYTIQVDTPDGERDYDLDTALTVARSHCDGVDWQHWSLSCVRYD